MNISNIKIKTNGRSFFGESSFFIIFMILMICADSAFAGTGGTELNGIFSKVEGIVKGTGGKLAALSMFIVGSIHALTQHTVKVFIPTFLGSVVLGAGPAVVTSGFTALIP